VPGINHGQVNHRKGGLDRIVADAIGGKTRHGQQSVGRHKIIGTSTSEISYGVSLATFVVNFQIVDAPKEKQWSVPMIVGPCRAGGLWSDRGERPGVEKNHTSESEQQHQRAGGKAEVFSCTPVDNGHSPYIFQECAVYPEYLTTIYATAGNVIPASCPFHPHRQL
jgi:hypothetical protein